MQEQSSKKAKHHPLASSSQRSKFRKPLVLLAALLRCSLVSRGRNRAAPLPTHLLRICAGTLKRHAPCAVSEFASGQRHTVALPRKHLLTLLPQIFCFAKSLREPYIRGRFPEGAEGVNAVRAAISRPRRHIPLVPPNVVRAAISRPISPANPALAPCLPRVHAERVDIFSPICYTAPSEIREVISC